MDKLIKEALQKKGYSLCAIDFTKQIVLARRDEDGEYVTWYYNPDGGFYWGNYFPAELFKEAVKDFYKRCNQ